MANLAEFSPLEPFSATRSASKYGKAELGLFGSLERSWIMDVSSVRKFVATPVAEPPVADRMNTFPFPLGLER
jgi:hypothetical protein